MNEEKLPFWRSIRKEGFSLSPHVCGNREAPTPPPFIGPSVGYFFFLFFFPFFSSEKQGEVGNPFLPLCVRKKKSTDLEGFRLLPSFIMKSE